MTDGQVRYQQVQEGIRHNLEMEKLGQQEITVNTQRNEIAAREATVHEKAESRINSTWLLNQIMGFMNGAAGFVESITRSGKNITGMASDISKMSGSMSGGGYYQGSLFE